MRILVGEAWRGLRSEPSAALLSVIVVGLALYIPAMLFLASAAGERYARQLQAQVRLRAYLKSTVEPPAATLIGRVEGFPGVRSARLLDRDVLLAELEAEVGKDLLTGLPQNPLPRALEVTVTQSHATESGLATVAARLEMLPDVEEVVYGRAWAQKAERFFADVRIFLAVVTGILSLLVLAIAANTVRLIIRTRREAIGVWLLLGASPLYARVPYYIEGALAGLGGALFTLGLTFLTCLWVRSYVPALSFFTPLEMGIFLAVAVSMSLVGAVAAARRQIVPL